MPLQAGAIEQTAKRTQKAKHYVNPDGTSCAVIGISPRHYKATADGAWLDKHPAFKAGAGTNEYISDESDVTMRTYQTGSGGNRQYWIQFTDTLTGDGVEFRVLGQPSVTEGSPTLSFSDGASRTWTYTHTKLGGKMWGPPMTSDEPVTTYTFDYRLLGSAPALTVNAAGDLICGTLFRMPRSYMLGANGLEYPAGAWSIGTGTVSFSVDHVAAGLPAAAYPFRLDPSTTFTLASATDDGWVWKNSLGSAYPPTGGVSVDMTTANTGCEKDLDGGITNGLHRFDTSSIPDTASVTGAVLSGYCSSFSQVNAGLNYAIEYYTWSAVAGDYAQDPVNTVAASVALNTLGPANANNQVTFSDLTGISKTGYTSLRTHLTGVTPTGVNSFYFASIEHATLAELQLTVDYLVDSPTSRQASSATASGTGTSVTVNKQTGTTASDRVSATMAFQGGSGVTITPPVNGAWTLVDRRDSGTAIGIATYSRTADGSGAAETFTLSSSQKWVSACESYTSPNGIPTLDAATGGANASSTSIAAPGVTTTANNDLLKFAGAIAAGQAGGISPATGMTELADVQTGTAAGGTAAAKTLYFLGSRTADSNFYNTQDGGTGPATAMFSPVAGWILAAGTVGNTSEMFSQVERLANTFSSNTTTPKPATPSNTNGNGFRSPTTYTGDFANTAWTIGFGLRSTTAAWDGRGRFRYRIFASTDPTFASNVRELTSATQVTAATTAALTTTTVVAVSGNWTPGAVITLNNEYLLMTVAFEVTTAGTSGNTKDVDLAVGTSARIATSTFTPAVDLALEVASEIIATSGTATGTRTATAGTNAAVSVASLIALKPAVGSTSVQGTVSIASPKGTLTSTALVRKNASATLSATGAVTPVVGVTRKSGAASVSLAKATLTVAGITRKSPATTTSLAGAGSVSPAGVTRKSGVASIAGAATQSATAVVRKSGVATIAGTGTQSATAVVRKSGAAPVLSAAASVSATGVVRKSASASITSTSSLGVSAGASPVQGQVTISAPAASVSVGGTTHKPATAAIEAHATASVTSAPLAAVGSASVSSPHASVSAVGINVLPGGAVSIAGSGSLSTASTSSVTGEVKIGIPLYPGEDLVPGPDTVLPSYVGAVVSATGVTSLPGASASVSGSAQVVVTPRIVAQGEVDLTSTSSVTVDGTVSSGITPIEGASSITASASLTPPPAGVVRRQGSVAITSHASLDTGGVSPVSGGATIAGGSSVSSSGVTARPASATIASVASVTSAGVTAKRGASSIAGATSTGTITGVIALVGSSVSIAAPKATISASAMKVAIGQALIGASSTMSETPLVRKSATASISAHASVSLNGVQPLSGASSIVGVATLLASATTTKPAGGIVSGGGSLSASGRIVVVGSAAISAHAAVATAGVITVIDVASGEAHIQCGASLTCNPLLRRLGIAPISAHASLIAVAPTPPSLWRDVILLIHIEQALSHSVSFEPAFDLSPRVPDPILDPQLTVANF